FPLREFLAKTKEDAVGPVMAGHFHERLNELVRYEVLVAEDLVPPIGRRANDVWSAWLVDAGENVLPFFHLREERLVRVGNSLGLEFRNDLFAESLVV